MREEVHREFLDRCKLGNGGMKIVVLTLIPKNSQAREEAGCRCLGGDGICTNRTVARKTHLLGADG